MRLVWCRHLTPVAVFEPGPCARRRLRQPELEEGGARRQLGQPDVVPVSRCVLGLRDTSRRIPYGPEAKALTARPSAAEANDSSGHQFSDGRSSRSMTSVSVSVFDDSSFSPSCSCTALNTDGPVLSGTTTSGGRRAPALSKFIFTR